MEGYSAEDLKNFLDSGVEVARLAGKVSSKLNVDLYSEQYSFSVMGCIRGCLRKKYGVALVAGMVTHNSAIVETYKLQLDKHLEFICDVSTPYVNKHI